MGVYYSERFSNIPKNNFSEGKEHLYIGGYGSSKSQSLLQGLLTDLINRKHKIAICRQEFSTHINSTYALTKRLLTTVFPTRYTSRLGKSTTSVQFKNGSELIFLGLTNPEKLKSLDGVEKVLIEEASEITEDGYNEILGRLRVPKVKIILATNPLTHSNWIHTRFFSDVGLDVEELYIKKNMTYNNVFYHHSTVMDNPFVPEDYVQQLRNYKNTDIFRYECGYRGRFGVLGSRVFPIIKTGDYSHIRGDTFYGVDFGFTISYNSVVKIIIKGNNLYIVDQIYNNETTNPELAKEMKAKGWGNVDMFCDNSESKSIRELIDSGVNALKCKKFGVSESIKYLRNFSIHIDSKNCPNAVRDMTEECYRKTNGVIDEKRFTIDNHTRDSVIYALSYFNFQSLKGDNVNTYRKKEHNYTVSYKLPVDMGRSR